ncbi:hypothetical protein ACZ87_03824 [Candidatus Erwinia dacicola]|uniref:Uncharacterized protein n=1 Tax=Candidatus Erwinia dacicola TaxID=252393 RepID=A0A328TKF2_9GAMM|nr:hypothetical protein ACZ87_03824 [Candidatus Erwinia dacicola]
MVASFTLKNNSIFFGKTDKYKQNNGTTMLMDVSKSEITCFISLF